MIPNIAFLACCQEGVKHKMKKYVKKVQEDAPVNSVAGGGVAGLTGEPPVGSKAKRKYQRKNKGEADERSGEISMLRRALPEETERTGRFAGNQTFVVPSDIFANARNQKKKGGHWTKYIGEGEHSEAIKAYDRKHKGKKPIILQDERTGAMCYAKYGKQ